MARLITSLSAMTGQCLMHCSQSASPCFPAGLAAPEDSLWTDSPRHTTATASRHRWVRIAVLGAFGHVFWIALGGAIQFGGRDPASRSEAARGGWSPPTLKISYPHKSPLTHKLFSRLKLDQGTMADSSNLRSAPIPISSNRHAGMRNAGGHGHADISQSMPQAPVIGSLPAPKLAVDMPNIKLPDPSPAASSVMVSPHS